jgi:citrate synthase
MSVLVEKMSVLAANLREERKALSKAHEETKIGEVTAGQVLGGMRGIPALVCDTSSVNADEGLRIRNMPILDLTTKLPEEIFWLLLTGEHPSAGEVEELRAEFARHADIPEYVFHVLKAMPADSHAMTMFSTAVLVMGQESVFRKQYDEGINKNDLWKPMLEDSIILLGRITGIAAAIYRMKFKDGVRIAPDPTLDWGANYAKMLGVSDDPKFIELIRMYLVLHSDHEGGNVSAMTGNTVASALSDIYYSISAALNGLAGPLHGLANQECLGFVMEIYEHFKGVPTDEQLKQFAWDRLNSGQVIPGYGHAVLRVEDPRFTAFYNFGKANIDTGTDPIFGIVDALYNVIPGVLTEQGKAKNVKPNVDAASGSLLYHFGLKEYDFYTVMFGVSRAMGICAQVVLARAAGNGLIRPKGLTTMQLKKTLGV